MWVTYLHVFQFACSWSHHTLINFVSVMSFENLTEIKMGNMIVFILFLYVSSNTNSSKEITSVLLAAAGDTKEVTFRAFIEGMKSTIIDRYSSVDLDSYKGSTIV